MSGIQSETTMYLAHFHDFYFLEALKANISMAKSANPELQFSHSVNKLEEDVEAFYDYFVPNIAFRTFVYLYAVCYGEARHARENQAVDRYFPSTGGLHRTECYTHVLEFPPNKENLNTLTDIFKQEWRSGFGGQAWLNIAEALRYYGNVSDAAFIDHVIDLEHNGGTAFNKEDARKAILFDTSYPSDHFKNFLDWKFSKNILETPPQFLSKVSLTGQVFRLVMRYNLIFRTKPTNWVSRGNQTLTEYTVVWGEDTLKSSLKWCEWIDVTAGNKPDAKKLFSLSLIDDIYPGNMTEKEMLKEVKIRRKNALAKVRFGKTKVLRQALDKHIQKWVEWAMKHVVAPKRKVTYSILPCKVKSSGFFEVTLQIPAKFAGYGKKTDFGFECKFKLAATKIVGNTTGYDGKGKWMDAHIHKNYSQVVLEILGTNLPIENKELEAYIT